jgi:hypothetical protein
MKSKYVAIALVAFAPLSINGARAATLSGQAFVTAQGGERVTCAGREVTVTPDAPMRSAATVHRTICDSQGRFAFDGLGMQGWTIHTAIKWDVRGKQGIRHLGGDLTYDVVLKSTDTSLVLNDHDIVTRSSGGHELAQAGP